MSVTNKFNKYKKPVSKDVHLWNTMKLEVEREDLHSSWQQTRSAPWPPALIPKTLASQRVKLLLAKPQSKAESAQSSLQSCPAGTSTNLLHLRYTQQAGLKKLRKTFIFHLPGNFQKHRTAPGPLCTGLVKDRKMGQAVRVSSWSSSDHPQREEKFSNLFLHNLILGFCLSGTPTLCSLEPKPKEAAEYQVTRQSCIPRSAKGKASRGSQVATV